MKKILRLTFFLGLYLFPFCVTAEIVCYEGDKCYLIPRSETIVGNCAEEDIGKECPPDGRAKHPHATGTICVLVKKNLASKGTPSCAAVECEDDYLLWLSGGKPMGICHSVNYAESQCINHCGNCPDGQECRPWLKPTPRTNKTDGAYDDCRCLPKKQPDQQEEDVTTEETPTSEENPVSEENVTTEETPTSEDNPKSEENPVSEEGATTEENPASEDNPKSEENPASEDNPKSEENPVSEEGATTGKTCETLWADQDEALACCKSEKEGKATLHKKNDGNFDYCECKDNKKWENNQCIDKPAEVEPVCVYKFNAQIKCKTGKTETMTAELPLPKSLVGENCTEDKKLEFDTWIKDQSEAVKQKVAELCPKEKDRIYTLKIDIVPKISEDNLKKAKTTVGNFLRSADDKASKWKDVEGNFNTARLASDLTAGVVLGTVGGVVSGVVIKKKQIEKGFEVLHCDVGGQKMANWGDTFTIGFVR